MQLKIKLLILLGGLFVLGQSGCVSNVKSGLNPNYEGYISSRIATFPCQLWPRHLEFVGLKEINVSEEVQRQACEYFDDFVVDVFKNQPFIRGLSSKMSYQLLKQQSLESRLNLSMVWKKNKACPRCSNPQSLYRESIQTNPSWSVWLIDTSIKIRNADTLLLPFITNMEERTYQEQGIHIKRRAIEVALFLIDTDNSNIIWSNYKKVDASKKTLGIYKDDHGFNYTDWKVLYERVFTPQLLIDFPGRQIF